MSRQQEGAGGWASLRGGGGEGRMQDEEEGKGGQVFQCIFLHRESQVPVLSRSDWDEPVPALTKMYPP